jgi:hypothetical protein
MPGWNDQELGMFSPITLDDMWDDLGGGLGIAALIFGAHTGALQALAGAGSDVLGATDGVFDGIWD